jgi:hypothetical protein
MSFQNTEILYKEFFMLLLKNKASVRISKDIAKTLPNEAYFYLEEENNESDFIQYKIKEIK